MKVWVGIALGESRYSFAQKDRPVIPVFVNDGAYENRRNCWGGLLDELLRLYLGR